MLAQLLNKWRWLELVQVVETLERVTTQGTRQRDRRRRVRRHLPRNIVELEATAPELVIRRFTDPDRRRARAEIALSRGTSADDELGQRVQVEELEGSGGGVERSLIDPRVVVRELKVDGPAVDLVFDKSQMRSAGHPRVTVASGEDVTANVRGARWAAAAGTPPLSMVRRSLNRLEVRGE